MATATYAPAATPLNDAAAERSPSQTEMASLAMHVPKWSDDPDDKPSASPSAVSIAQQHYDPSREVVLRSEFLPERQFKGLAWGVGLVHLFGILVLQAYIRVHSDLHAGVLLRLPIMQSINLGIGVPCWAGLTVAVVMYWRRIQQARKSGKSWVPKRLRIVILIAARLMLTYVAVVIFVIVNLYTLARKCSWFHHGVIAAGVLQWTCFNSVFVLVWAQADVYAPGEKHSDAVLRWTGTPRIVSWAQLMLWTITEGVIIALGVLTRRSLNGAADLAKSAPDCTHATYSCSPTTAVTVLYGIVLAAFMVYYIAAVFVFKRVICALQARPYHEMRDARHNLNFQMYFDGLLCTLSAATIACGLYIRYGSCASYLQFWLGSAPIIFPASGLMAAYAYLAMPAPRDGSEILQIWLQEFSWTENGLDAAKAERGSNLSRDGLANIDREPMFCFETSLKLLLWARLMYQYEEAPKPTVTLEAAMKLYKLTAFELLWERETDTKAMIAWSEDTVVLAFRGTASLRNVLADLQAWRTPYKAARGRRALGTRPYVHCGFLRSWTAQGFNQRLVARMRDIVAAMPLKGRRARILITGHSLGGAMATLAAIEISAACPADRVSISCYTFGAPRTGNRAFAREYDAAVPDTWSVINDQDAVVHRGKFIKLYKRPGQRVIINAAGDVIVRPYSMEVHQQQKGAKVSHHVLSAYQRTFVRVLRAQLGPRATPGGLEGVRALEASGALSAAQLLHLSGEDVLSEAPLRPARRPRRTLMSRLTQLACLSYGVRGSPSSAVTPSVSQVLPSSIEDGDECDAPAETAVTEELEHGGDVELGSGGALPRPAAGTSAAARPASTRLGAGAAAAAGGSSDASTLAQRALQRVSGRLDSTGRAVVDRDERAV